MSAIYEIVAVVGRSLESWRRQPTFRCVYADHLSLEASSEASACVGDRWSQITRVSACVSDRLTPTRSQSECNLIVHSLH